MAEPARLPGYVVTVGMFKYGLNDNFETVHRDLHSEYMDGAPIIRRKHPNIKCKQPGCDAVIVMFTITHPRDCHNGLQFVGNGRWRQHDGTRHIHCQAGHNHCQHMGDEWNLKCNKCGPCPWTIEDGAWVLPSPEELRDQWRKTVTTRIMDSSHDPSPISEETSLRLDYEKYRKEIKSEADKGSHIGRVINQFLDTRDGTGPIPTAVTFTDWDDWKFDEPVLARPALPPPPPPPTMARVPLPIPPPRRMQVSLHAREMEHHEIAAFPDNVLTLAGTTKQVQVFVDSYYNSPPQIIFMTDNPATTLGTAYAMPDKNHILHWDWLGWNYEFKLAKVGDKPGDYDLISCEKRLQPYYPVNGTGPKGSVSGQPKDTRWRLPPPTKFLAKGVGSKDEVPTDYALHSQLPKFTHAAPAPAAPQPPSKRKSNKRAKYKLKKKLGTLPPS